MPASRSAPVSSGSCASMWIWSGKIRTARMLASSRKRASMRTGSSAIGIAPSIAATLASNSSDIGRRHLLDEAAGVHCDAERLLERDRREVRRVVDEARVAELRPRKRIALDLQVVAAACAGVLPGRVRPRRQRRERTVEHLVEAEA